MKIVIDAMGGDNAPSEIVKGAIKAVNKLDNLSVVLVGKKEQISQILFEKKELDNKKIEIVDAEDVISNNDIPTVAIRSKSNSSLVKAFDILKNNDEVVGLISAGSTGAILTGAILKIGRIKGISRPALCPILPTKNGGHVLLVDCGANMDCKPINLCHFALMADQYMKSMLGVKNPRVSLLNVGTEDHKGNELCKETFPMLKELPLNFVGNMEARDLFSGEYDIVVTDGYAGNILLKGVEGAISLVTNEIKKSIKKGFFSKIGAAFMLNTFTSMKKKLDYNRYGGSPFIGTNKLVVKSHGSSKRKTILACIEQIIKLEKSKMISNIEKTLMNVEIAKSEE